MQKKSKKNTSSLPQSIMIGYFILSSLIVSLFVWRLPPKIPFFFSRPFGESQLVSPWWLIAIPVLHLGLYLGSKGLQKWMEDEKVLLQMFFWMEFFVGFLLLMSLFYVLFLVY